jgi:hydrogenase maturation protein HypF
MDKRKEENRQGIKIKLYGIVQGVGFRPFVVKLADSLGIAGAVKNSGGRVEICAYGQPDALRLFSEKLISDKPVQSILVHQEITPIPLLDCEGFSIAQSDAAEGPVFLPPDICVCDNCLAEMRDKGDKRYCHPFISCMDCGPRYSVIEATPYDRETTTMADYAMCSFCHTQYRDRQARRYHAQTISCHDCGPYLIYRDNESRESIRETAFDCAADALKKGGIVAVKGIGGYHLCCTPYDEAAVLRLRELKRREQKPFAVMFPGLEAIRQHAFVSPEEEQLLLSSARPVVLLVQKPNNLAPAVCNQSRYVGAFLPYTPLQALLMASCGALVTTSANISEEPVIKDDAPILSWEGLDGVLYNDRRIAARMDDSVVKYVAGGVQVIRRSRGYAPLPVILRGFDQGSVFAAGGHLKSTFCLASGAFAYVGPHIGDLDNEDCMAAYCESLERMQRLFRIQPQMAVCDMHPGYAANAYAKSLGLTVLEAQHHHAHIASVMAEHSLQTPVIGVSFDGTGWGTDGTIWGGEFLVCHADAVERAGHLKPVKLLNGDEGMKDAAKSAMCYLADTGLAPNFQDERWPVIRAALAHGINTHGNSGMGRLFDAVSAVMGISRYNRYEGECATLLENLAAEAIAAGIEPVSMAFGVSQKENVWVADASPLFTKIMQGGADKRAIALGFHHAVADMTLEICQKIKAERGINDVALSGGVFQNAVLLKDLKDKLADAGFTVYINRLVPPNDGGISLGQAYIGMMRLKKG